MDAETQSWANEIRHSRYPMVEMGEAMRLVLLQASPLPPTVVPLDLVRLGSVLVENVIATTDIPQYPTSIVDGYAVGAPCESGVYPIVGRIYTDTKPYDGNGIQVAPGQCVYITTGAILPNGTNAVLKVESTETVIPASGRMGTKESIMQNENEVKFLFSLKAGQDVRQPKSDMHSGTTILEAGQSLGPAEIGLLAACGGCSVPVFRQAKIGVISTGNELVEPCETPQMGAVRDINRIMLLSYVRSQGAEGVDLGIVRDVKSSLESVIQASLEKCDVLVTSGGVSMGEIDLLKPLLEKLGEVHFGRICMKPGKPTIFATICKGNQKKLILALPGNPVSSLVTAQLFLRMVIKRLHGASPSNSLPTQIQVNLEGNFFADPNREEYQRAMVRWNNEKLCFTAKSTGSQISSRILSCKSCNALLIFPAGSGLHAEGSFVTAILVGELPPPEDGLGYFCERSHRNAAFVTSPQPCVVMNKPTESTTITETTAVEVVDRSTSPIQIRAGIITVSDRAASKKYSDTSGPLIKEWLQTTFVAECLTIETRILPDEVVQVRDLVKHWADNERLDIVLTTGGTGFSLRDTTPDSVAPLLEREAPGIVHALLQAGLSHTPLAALSRPVAGIRGNTIIITLPGSPKAIKENIVVLRQLLPHIIKQLQGFECGTAVCHATIR